MTAQAKRILGIALVTVAFGVGVGLYVGIYLTAAPGQASARISPSGAHLYLATVPAAALNDPHPTWVSYYAVNPDGSHWRHDTTYVLPAHTLVQVTIYQYDSATGLRNPFLGQGEGLSGGRFTLDGKPTVAINPNLASHVFAIPAFGVSVPLAGVSANAKNTCGNAPCTLSQAHTTTTFSFRTPARGLYRWQCFVPCGAGFIAGWGGPMQTVGYMDGYIKVV
ncbi:MAG TPA: hypothetical protein VKV21_16360 [Solirubrobacteraceae bacterium]|nr:hypothetical protein [Solirubrobacteraceae bacterium]